jgi:hypothetical protein
MRSPRSLQRARPARFCSPPETAPLVEASPFDAYWGCGRSGKGKNRLGQLLMQVRAKLRSEGEKALWAFCLMFGEQGAWRARPHGIDLADGWPTAGLEPEGT